MSLPRSPFRSLSGAEVVDRTLRSPSTAVWLNRVSLATAHLDDALAFYSQTLGLAMRTLEGHPLRPGCLRAVLADAEGHDALELVETDEPVPEQTELSFAVPRRAWYLVRARLAWQDRIRCEGAGALYTQDPDGRLVRIEALDVV